MTPPNLAAAIIILTGAGFVSAGTPAATASLSGKPADGSIYERLWSVPTLYRNESHPWLQEFSFQGMLQLQYAAGTDDSGNFGSDDRPDDSTWGNIEVRRFRFGIRARMFHSLKLHTLWDLDPEFSQGIYDRTFETYATWSPHEAFNLSAGKTLLRFTREQEISAREILTFERSRLSNQFLGGELTGAWISGKRIAGGWFYELGAYGNDRRDEWSEFDGGAIILAKAGYLCTGLPGFDSAKTAIHYLHNTAPGYTDPSGGTPSPPYSDCIAVSNELVKDRFSFSSELFWGAGADGAPDVFGTTVMPGFYLSEKLQLVTAVELAGSRGEDGITLPGRYEALAPGGNTGDFYFSGYAGLNYYFHGHKLKLMSGVKHTRLSGGEDDFNGWTWLAGLRVSF